MSNKVFKITTSGLCDIGTAIVVADSVDNAKRIFYKEFPVNDEDYENEIQNVEEIKLHKQKVMFYDDGDR